VPSGSSYGVIIYVGPKVKHADVPRGRSKRPFGDDARSMMDLLVVCALP
jgi:hypothetical protein